MMEFLANGAQVGGYVIQGMLGRGGMGTVYKAVQTSIGRVVALKILHPQRMARDGARQRFLAEARVAANLQHSGLVTIHEVGLDPATNLVFYSMEYIHGRTLATVIHQDGALERGLALGIAAQLAAALAAAHARNLVHRDVKPPNVIMTGDGRAKLTDLGLALDRVGTVNTESCSRTLRIVGTPHYSAPEQLRNPDRATPASDVYSLGATLLEMLSGRSPFSGESLFDLVIRIGTEDPPALEDLSPDLQRLIARLMAKDPDARPQDGAAAQTEIQALAVARPAHGHQARHRLRRR